MDDLTLSIEHLKRKYPLGSIYLTYIPLNDMAHRLNEDGNLNQLVAEEAAPLEIFQSLKAFLVGMREPEMNRSIAFLQLELNTGEAGFKRASDQDGAIYSIAWSQDEVFRIAKFSDAFINKLFRFEKTHSSLAAGDLPLDRGWRMWKKLKADPYIPTVRKMALDRDWWSLINEKPGELKGLKSTNPKVYEAIQTFSTSYDRELSALTSEKALELLRVKSAELADALVNFKTKHEDYLAVLGSKQVEDSLKHSIPLFEKAGFSMEGAHVPNDFIQIYRGIVGEPSLPQGDLGRGTIKAIGNIGRGGRGPR